MIFLLIYSLVLLFLSSEASLVSTSTLTGGHGSFLPVDEQLANQSNLSNNNDNTWNNNIISLSYENQDLNKDIISDLKLKIEPSVRLDASYCLSLNKCRISTNDFVSIFNVTLRNTSNVQSLSLKHCGLNFNHISQYKRGKGILSDKLISLDVSYSDLGSGEEAGRSLSSIIKRLPNLEEFIFDGNKVNEGNDSNLFQLIIYSIRRHPSIHRLSFAHCALTDDSMKHVSKALQANKNITHINLCNNMITSAGLLQLSAAVSDGGLRHLESLDLSYNYLGDEGVLTLAACIRSGHLPRLKRLILRQV